MKKILAGILAAALMTYISPSSGARNYRDIERDTYSLLEEYDNVARVNVEVLLSYTGFETEGDGHFAETSCTERRKGWECTIRYHHCTINSRDYTDAIKHEVAHVIAITKERDYGHGLAWFRLMRRMDAETGPLYCRVD